MKNLLVATVFGIFTVVLMTGCASSPLLIQNSNGYNFYMPKIDNAELHEKRPEWFGDNWTNWQEQEEQKGHYRYVMGISDPGFNKDHSDVMAVAQAQSHSFQQIANIIGNNIEVNSDLRIQESENSSVVQQGHRVAALRRQQEDVMSLVNVEMDFASYIEGLSVHGSYSEKWMVIKQNQNKTIEVNKVWMVYRISNEDIAAAQQRILDERAAVQDELTRQKSREGRHEIYFRYYSQQFANLKVILNNPQISQEEKSVKYIDLVDMYVRLEKLSTMRNDPQYISLIEEVRIEISNHDPANYVRHLEMRLVESDARLDELRRERNQQEAELAQIITGTGRQEYSLQTQTIIISFPQRPYETGLPSVNLLAANDMVSNKDYISFTNINGINNLSRAEYGLEVPVTTVTWNDAARYCNWLSRLYGLEPCYRESGGRITGYDKTKKGYRLPEEDEIIAMLQSEAGIINENEFTGIGIWCSSGFPEEHRAYRLSERTGAVIDRLMSQSFNNPVSDSEIGFRVVRNAK